jgi:hypothetical protein
MDNDTKMPPVAFGEGCDYSMLDDILKGWVVRLWVKDGPIIVGEWLGSRFMDDGSDGALIKSWRAKENDYRGPEVLIKTDLITKIEIQ